jgi:hypothetical protein
MLDASWGDTCRGGGLSVPPTATDMAAVTITAASSEANTRPPSSVGIDVTTTAVTTAADIADNAHCNPAINVDSGPSPTALGDDADSGGAGNTLVQVAIVSIILNATKSSLCAYFEGVNWPLNKALPKGAEFLNGLLGDIMRQFLLVKMQVARQLLNYKKEKFMNSQVSILLNSSNLDERIREGMAMSAPKFVSSTLLRICNPDPSSYGSNFSNHCVVMKSLPSTARTYVQLIANRPDDACFCLIVSVVENWIQSMVERFPQTAAGVPNAQLDFERAKKMKMRAYVADFMKEYDSTGLPPADVSRISFGRLGAFLHLALFQAWSNAVCDNKKPPIEFLVDCLVGRYALPVVYYVAVWMLFSMSKASTVAANNRPECFTFAASQTIDEKAAKRMNLLASLVERRKLWASIYCSREYFDFLCCIESIFLANLMLKMMLAYSSGDIVTRIKMSVLSHNEMRERIYFLSGSNNKADNQLLLTNIVERYANMRGTYFCQASEGK